jgi:acetylornithine deacetylase/succinyl-diaminopimelate desuccinylase-like protein
MWTAPARGERVRLHVAAVAGDGDESQMGDHVYTLEAESLAAVGTPVAAPARQTDPDPAAIRAAVAAHRDASETAVMNELRALLAVPNLASDPADIRRNADLLVSMLEKRGVEARVLELDGTPPAVYGELRSPGAARTVVLYAHFDGQPVDPEEWASPPWEATLRAGSLADGAAVVPWADAPGRIPDDWRIYARSASDDKSPIVAYLAALDALRGAGMTPSVNLKFFLEGEEEVGSPNLAEMLRRHRPLLEADAWIFGDGPVHQSGAMQVVFGVRGIVSVQMTVYGPDRPLHSGHYGNWAPNPAVMLAHLLASMRDEEGGVGIAGFYDQVRRPSRSEWQAMEALPAVEADLARDLALGRTEGQPESLPARLMLPALNVDGLGAGGVGRAARNAIPSEATAAIDIRLVPDMEPRRVRELVEAHIRAQGYYIVHQAPSPAERREHARVVRLEWEDGYSAVRTPLDLPVSRAVVATVAEILGGPVLKVPMLGGSLPLAHFEEQLGAPVIIVPMVNADNNQHAANENLRIGHFWDGVLVYAALVGRLGMAWE